MIIIIIIIIIIIVAADSSSGGWIRVAVDSILWLTRVPVAGYELWLTRVPAAGYELRLIRVPAAGQGLWLIPSHGGLEFQRLNTSCSWFHPTVVASSGGWIELWLTLSCDWLKICRLNSTCGWFILLLLFIIIYLFKVDDITLIYPVNLATYPAKYIIFIVCFSLADFSNRWFRLWLLLQEAWRSLKKLQVSSCDWF